VGEGVERSETDEEPIKIDFCLQKSTKIIHFLLFDIHYSLNNNVPSEIPTLCIALRVRFHSVSLRMTRTDVRSTVVLRGFDANGRSKPLPYRNTNKNFFHYRRATKT